MGKIKKMVSDTKGHAMTAASRTGRPIVFGLGSGRSGTASLAGLLNAQPGIVCFHEINPSSMAWVGAEDTVAALVHDFQSILAGGARHLIIDRTLKKREAPVDRMKSLETVRGIGDVAHYYLPYVETILAHAPQARFPCLKRDREATVRSFATKLRLAPHSRFERLYAWAKGMHLHTSRNHWDGSKDERWKADGRFDKCFPNYEGLETADLSEYVRRWYDEYYATIDALIERYPGSLRVFDMSCLNDSAGRRELLEFALPDTEINPDVAIHVNAGPACS